MTGASLTGWYALSITRASIVVFWPRYNLGILFNWKSVVPITETFTYAPVGANTADWLPVK